MKSRAFTLIELLVVVLIIGILSAIALPQYQLAVEKSRLMSVLPFMRAINTAQEEYKLANDTYATSFDDLSVSKPSNFKASCYFPTGSSLDCVSDDGAVIIEKYYFMDYYLCWPQNAKGEKLCKAISGKTAPGNACGGNGCAAYKLTF